MMNITLVSSALYTLLNVQTVIAVICFAVVVISVLSSFIVSSEQCTYIIEGGLPYTVTIVITAVTMQLNNPDEYGPVHDKP